ncbi:mechanosensitive ion channel family protein [Peribacillus huizhouensis]|uniref:Small-conductance mechanosensitive channel n=1 Tax=Peribacillus huizhouensis TaxID=1501239 RepID=A0ABR6CMD7_9BACI|nr:mechanosensitive ion channel family protein [Peribacillus huizhouensis]MBA9026191.1 small-conductance mechanosensitive channel [Peribacillus huizhouensis]
MSILNITEKISEYLNDFLLLKLVLVAVVLMILSYIINRTVAWFFKKSTFFEEEIAKTIQSVIRSTLRYGITILFIIYLIGQFIDLKGILAGAGIIGVIIGFAAQQMLKDILLGMTRLSDNEFRVGNFVTFNGTSSGTVEEIGVRFMQIREWSGKLLTIPHGEIRTIQNFNKGRMRVIEKVTVSYQEDPKRMASLLEEVCKICNEKYSQTLLRLEDGEPEQDFRYIGVTDLNPNKKYHGYELCIVGLVNPEDFFQTSRDVRFELMNVFYDNGVQMPAANLKVQQEKNEELYYERINE